MKVCAEPGCPTLVPSGSWCTTHQPARPTGRPGTTRYLEDERWRKLSRAYLRRHRVCECGCGRDATDVDHIDGQGLDGPRAYDWDNLIALAHSCHSRRTARQGTRASRGLPPEGGGGPPRAGGWPRGGVANLGQKPHDG